MNRGEIIELGRHRLMCGDATSRDDVMKLIGEDTVNLVLTDPPYGIDIVNSGGHFKGQWGKKRLVRLGYSEGNTAVKFPEIIGDKNTETARGNYGIIRDITDRHIIWGGQHFVDFLPVSNGWLVWNKKLNLNNYSACEMAYTSVINHNQMYEQKLCGFIKEGNRQLNPQPKIHPTQKPVELHMKILEDFSNPDDVILDCFGGSGTTLIACEMTGRKCLMMEISPEYCDVIQERYEKLTDGNIPFAG